MRGWPDELWAQSCEAQEEPSAADEQMDESIGSIWPIVELHENPLNSIPITLIGPKLIQRTQPLESSNFNAAANSTNVSLEREPVRPAEGVAEQLECTSDGDGDFNYDQDYQELSEILNRSRLLSLSESNQDKRAAIRMVSMNEPLGIRA